MKVAFDTRNEYESFVNYILANMTPEEFETNYIWALAWASALRIAETGQIRRADKRNLLDAATNDEGFFESWIGDTYGEYKE